MNNLSLNTKSSYEYIGNGYCLTGHDITSHKTVSKFHIHHFRADLIGRALRTSYV